MKHQDAVMNAISDTQTALGEESVSPVDTATLITGKSDNGSIIFTITRNMPDYGVLAFVVLSPQRARATANHILDLLGGEG